MWVPGSSGQRRDDCYLEAQYTPGRGTARVLALEFGSMALPARMWAMSEARGLPRGGGRGVPSGMIALVRAVRVLVLLLLAFFTVSLVIGLGTSDTGFIEKVVLLALIAVCVFLAAKVSALATKAQALIQRH
jgi:hypothetical protein